MLVHRLLNLALLYGPNMKEKVDKQYFESILDKCNEMRINSKRVSDGCDKVKF